MIFSIFHLPSEIFGGGPAVAPGRIAPLGHTAPRPDVAPNVIKRVLRGVWQEVAP